MEDLPSVSLSSWGRGRHRGSHNGRGVGRGLHLYSSLNSHDEVPLISPSEERGGLRGGEEVWESSGEEDLLEQPHWAGRKRWQQRIRTQSSLVGWFFDGGWQLLLKK